MDVAPAIAVVLPRAQSQTEEGQQWESTRRPRSQSPTSRRQRARKQKSANRVQSRPADVGVINSILDSFGTLTAPPSPYADEHHSETGSMGSRFSRPSSVDATSAKRASQPRAAGFGVEYGKGAPLHDETGTSDAALPPTIRTSKSRAVLSVYGARTPGPPSDETNNSYLRPSSINSRTSSRSSLAKEKERGVRSSHGSESRVKQTPKLADQESVPTDVSRKKRKSLKRVPSRETLKSANIEVTPVRPDLSERRTLSRVEQIIAMTPPTQDRIYMQDTLADERQPATDSPVVPPEVLMSAPIGTHYSAQNAVTDQPSPAHPVLKRISPTFSLIENSIPMRTSSLRHPTTRPRSSRKREERSSRQNVASSKSESVILQRSPAILESSWADLGEDDDTVKRIRQLREQRQSRIEEFNAYSFIAGSPEPMPSSNHDHMPQLSAAAREEHRRLANARPPPYRATTEPASKVHRFSGIAHSTPSLDRNEDVVADSKYEAGAERKQRPHSVQQDRTSHLMHTRPSTASSPTPPISLDYSYAQVVDALHGIGQEMQQGQQKTRPVSSASVTLKAQDLHQASPTPLLTRARSSLKSGGPRWRDSQEQGAANHPDLPLDFNRRKSRRHSTSDVRRTRYAEGEISIYRRDSVEHAVLEYLYAPRLNQKVRHPLTGRLISFSEVGDPEGAAVFICVGMGLTRYVTAFYDELATTLRLRLITIDRPGVGNSEPYPPTDRSGPLSWPDDVLAVCEQLGVETFSLLAHSAGAIYALATALTLPHLIKGKVHLLAPWIPQSQLGAVAHPMANAPPAGALPRSQRILRVLPASFLKAANSSFMTATSASLTPASKRQIEAAKARQREQSPSPTRASERPATGNRPDYHKRQSMMQMDQFMPTINPLETFPLPARGEEDEELEPRIRQGSLVLSATAGPTDPNLAFASMALNAAEHAEKERQIEYTSLLTQRTWELATRDSNPATDLLVCLERHREIGFRYTDVSCEVIITHGSEDKRVPLGNVRLLAEQMNARAYAGLTADFANNSLPQSREGWAEPGYSRGGCEVRILDGEGHGLMASAPIMSDILTEIAGHWSG